MNFALNLSHQLQAGSRHKIYAHDREIILPTYIELFLFLLGFSRRAVKIKAIVEALRYSYACENQIPQLLHRMIRISDIKSAGP